MRSEFPFEEFEDILYKKCWDEADIRNPKATAVDLSDIALELQDKALHALAQFAIKLAKEKSND
jgi:hypothetical protein